MTEVDVKTANQ